PGCGPALIAFEGVRDVGPGSTRGSTNRAADGQRELAVRSGWKLRAVAGARSPPSGPGLGARPVRTRASIRASVPVDGDPRAWRRARDDQTEVSAHPPAGGAPDRALVSCRDRV